MKKAIAYSFMLLLMAASWSCRPKSESSEAMDTYSVELIQLNPGHFHAGLVQKSMYEQVNPLVHLYAPGGPDLEDFLNRVDGYNSRADNPTSWEMKTYAGSDYLEKLLEEKAGNVVITAGNNARKTEYIRQAVEAGLNVLSDKPMVITPDKFDLLIEAFEVAEENGVLLYDIMTERYEITTILQRELSMIPEVFGELVSGTPEEPSITKESVHHLFKYVSGNPVKRPGWFFDINQQGTGVTDVGTHLVDLVQWECFPEQIIDYQNDIEVLNSTSWPTVMDAAMFEKVTQLSEFPDYLSKFMEGNELHYPCNSEMTYKIKGIHAKVSVIWNFQAPEGTGDTHYSIMRGTGCNLVIRQGVEEEFKPTLYIEPVNPDGAFGESLEKAIREKVSTKFSGVELEQVAQHQWKLNVPASYKVGHEAHFAQVTEKYLGFLEAGTMPEWEVPNMIAKYYTTTRSMLVAE